VKNSLPSPKSYVVSTLAGGDNDSGSLASFCTLAGIALGPNGNLYVTDIGNHTIFEVDAEGAIRIYAGQGNRSCWSNPVIVKTETADCKRATFDRPSGIAVDMAANVYVSEVHGHVIREIEPAPCRVSTLAGKRDEAGDSDGSGSAAKFNGPMGLAAMPLH